MVFKTIDYWCCSQKTYFFQLLLRHNQITQNEKQIWSIDTSVYLSWTFLFFYKVLLFFPSSVIITLLLPSFVSFGSLLTFLTLLQPPPQEIQSLRRSLIYLISGFCYFPIRKFRFVDKHREEKKKIEWIVCECKKGWKKKGNQKKGNVCVKAVKKR